MAQTQQVEKIPSPAEQLAQHLDAMAPRFAGALPKHIPLERFMRVVMTAVQRDPDLLMADRSTLLIAAQQAANDGLLPDGKEGAFVIYNTKQKRRDKDGREKEVWIEAVQWMVMIAGLRKKVRNSGEIADWQADVVHERDLFRYTRGDSPSLVHEPYLDGNPGKLIYAYSIAWFKDGTISREVMSAADVEKVRGASKAPGSPAWKVWFDEMAKKAVARRHAKTLPMSTDLDDLIRRDDQLYDFEGASDKQLPPPRPERRDFLVQPQIPPQIKIAPGNLGLSPELADFGGREVVGEPVRQEAQKEPAQAEAKAEGDKAKPKEEKAPAAPASPAKAETATDPIKAKAEADGAAAFKAGKSLHSTPDEFRGELEHLEAWKDGWRKAEFEGRPKKTD